MKDSSFFFFFFLSGQRRQKAAVNGSGQRSTAAVIRADVAVEKERAWRRWSARGSAWARGWKAKNFWRRVGARAGLDPADFGGNGQILMRSIQ